MITNKDGFVVNGPFKQNYRVVFGLTVEYHISIISYNIIISYIYHIYILIISIIHHHVGFTWSFKLHHRPQWRNNADLRIHCKFLNKAFKRQDSSHFPKSKVRLNGNPVH